MQEAYIPETLLEGRKLSEVFLCLLVESVRQDRNDGVIAFLRGRGPLVNEAFNEPLLGFIWDVMWQFPSCRAK